MSPTTPPAWLQCLDMLRTTVPAQQFRTWFEPLEYVSFEEGVLLLCVPNRFFYDYFDSHFAPYLMQAMKELQGIGVVLVGGNSTEVTALLSEDIEVTPLGQVSDMETMAKIYAAVDAFVTPSWKPWLAAHHAWDSTWEEYQR